MRISDWSSDVCSSDLSPNPSRKREGLTTLAIRRRIAYIIPMYDYVSVTIADAASPTPVRAGTIQLHDAAGFAGMCKAGRLSAEILAALVPFPPPGVHTPSSATSRAGHDWLPTVRVRGEPDSSQ